MMRQRRPGLNQGRSCRAQTDRREALQRGLLLLLLTAACHQPNGPPAERNAAGSTPAGAAVTNTDPCAMRLHDICGPLLMYYAARRELPARLEDLSRVPGFGNVRDFTCPASGRPYIYNRIGLIEPKLKSRVILYDAAPSHANMRWGVSVIEPAGDAPLITKVIAVPESIFAQGAAAP